MAKHKWNIDNIADQQGKIAIVTCSSSGIGMETARVSAHKRATVIIAVRNKTKGQAAVDRIRGDSGNKDVHLMELDLVDLASVRKYATQFKEKFSRLNLLINNAGVMVPPFTRTRDEFLLCPKNRYGCPANPLCCYGS
jgi:NAD(P)-dependent dehydrogenase (short-subunit alcohol dehydrogenase family)